MRSARSRLPAPILVPTSATSGPPMPNTSGTSRYSSRAAVPKPATAAGPAAAPTRAVVAAIVTLVCTVLTAADRADPQDLARTAPSAAARCAAARGCGPTARTSRAPACRPDCRATSATPPPAMPIAGIGPKPKIRSGESGTSRTRRRRSPGPAPACCRSRGSRWQMRSSSTAARCRRRRCWNISARPRARPPSPPIAA